MTNKPYWLKNVLRMYRISEEYKYLLHPDVCVALPFISRNQILRMYTSLLNEMYSILWKHGYDDIDDLPSDWLNG